MAILKTNELILDMKELMSMYPDKRIVPLLSSSIIEDTELISYLSRFRVTLELEHGVILNDFPIVTKAMWWRVILMDHLASRMIINYDMYELFPEIRKIPDNINVSVGYKLLYQYGSISIIDSDTGVEVQPYLVSEHTKVKLLLALLISNGALDNNSLLYITEEYAAMLTEYLASLEAWGVTLVVVGNINKG